MAVVLLCILISVAVIVTNFPLFTWLIELLITGRVPVLVKSTLLFSPPVTVIPFPLSTKAYPPSGLYHRPP